LGKKDVYNNWKDMSGSDLLKQASYDIPAKDFENAEIAS